MCWLKPASALTSQPRSPPATTGSDQPPAPVRSEPSAQRSGPSDRPLLQPDGTDRRTLTGAALPTRPGPGRAEPTSPCRTAPPHRAGPPCQPAQRRVGPSPASSADQPRPTQNRPADPPGTLPSRADLAVPTSPRLPDQPHHRAKPPRRITPRPAEPCRPSRARLASPTNPATVQNRLAESPALNRGLDLSGEVQTTRPATSPADPGRSRQPPGTKKPPALALSDGKPVVPE